MEFLRHSAPRRGGSGQCNFRNALPHCLGSVGSGTPTTHCVTAWGQWAVEPLQCTASLPGGSDQLDSCGVVWCGVVWCGVVWCGVVWCGVVWCGVVWCGVPKALLPKGKGRDVYPRVQVNGLGCVCCVRAVCKCVVA